jgi:Domain of unknown function (DUF4062)
MVQARKYQIFVSSTYLDLIKERQDAIKAIVDLGHMPSGMEGFPAIDMEQFEYIKKVIDQCDYYVLIIGNRYGSQAPDGVSFTEKEYHYAIKTGRVVLAFVKDLAGESPDLTREGKKFAAFRDHVRKTRIVHEWAAGDDLRYPVSRSLREAFEQQPKEGWVRAENVQKPPSKLWHWVGGAVVGIAGFIGLAFFLGDAPKVQVGGRQTTDKASVALPKGQQAPEIDKPQKNSLAPADVPTKLAIWDSVATRHMDEFARALNDAYTVQGNWDITDKSNRLYFLQRFPVYRQNLVDASEKLEKLRQDYPQYADVSEGLKQSKMPGLLNAFDAFVKGFGTDADNPPENYARTMRPLTGELKRQLDSVRDWQSSLRQQAAAKQKELQ